MAKIMNAVRMKILLALTVAASTSANVITIGRGTGIVWEGMPFNATLSGKTDASLLTPSAGLLAISTKPTMCMDSRELTMIGGYLALPLDDVPGVGLIPIATGSASYVREDGNKELMNGTIGLPETAGSSTSNASINTPVTDGQSNYGWCLPPDIYARDNFYSRDAPRTATLSGVWALVADGTQKSGTGKIPPMYFASLSGASAGDLSAQILSANIDLRISTLECTVNTPTAIDFGTVARNTQPNVELALKNVGLVTTCSQTSNNINTNINLQFRAISGLYDNTPSRLALKQGGGYITGQIDNGVTDSGACQGTGGLRFDNSPVKLGAITGNASSQIFVNNMIWRLCSGGKKLPDGPVHASAEMLVTFN